MEWKWDEDGKRSAGWNGRKDCKMFVMGDGMGRWQGMVKFADLVSRGPNRGGA